MGRGGWGRLFDEGNYLKYFGQRAQLFEGGDLLRDGYYLRKYRSTLFSISVYFEVVFQFIQCNWMSFISKYMLYVKRIVSEH